MCFIKTKGRKMAKISFDKNFEIEIILDTIQESLDFKDELNGEEQILESIAMTTKKALRLSEGLKEAVDILNKNQSETQTIIK